MLINRFSSLDLFPSIKGSTNLFNIDLIESHASMQKVSTLQYIFLLYPKHLFWKFTQFD